MLPLSEFQARFVTAIFADEHAEEPPLAACGRVSAAAAIEVHRGTIMAALTAALAVSFPTVHRLVGGDFFNQAAMAYAHAHPPGRGGMNNFGSKFPDFLASFPPASGLAYLADVSRFDLAIEHVLAGPADLVRQRIGIDRTAALSIPANLIVLNLAYPADLIRHHLEAGDDAALAGIDLQSAPRWLAVWRSQCRAYVKPIGLPAGIFLAELIEHGDSERAFTAAHTLGGQTSILESIRLDVFAATFTLLIITSETDPA